MRKLVAAALFVLQCVVYLSSTWLAGAVYAQSVCLPAPRLLTTMPLGVQRGTEVEVVVTGQALEGAEQLIFSNPKITALPKLDEQGDPIANHYVVSVDADCPVGVYDARVMAGLGISSARAFSVSDITEVTQTKPCTSLESALNMSVDSICNATLVDRNVNHYVFDAEVGQEIVVDCAAKGIDSRMNPVVILADAEGNDLVVQRRGGRIEFTPEISGRYLVKVHDLTFKGGAHYFYRLAIRNKPADGSLPLLPATKIVSSFSWPPVGLPELAKQSEIEPNDSLDGSQVIELPCDIQGSFYPAADVDSYEFDAKKGDEWWVEVASERLGRPTDPFAVVQRIVTKEQGGQTARTVEDVVELWDIDSPVKRSSNGYSYDGPPYNAGSTDVLGKFTVPEDGRYRIRLTDLFGGTRNDANNVYRLIVRKAQPDFALVSWAMHMGLRNGDRNALSKPIALRGGATIPFEVVVVRRDGFDGPIQIRMENLPEGVRATGLTIQPGQKKGILLVSADQNAPRGLTMASVIGSAAIDGKNVERECHWASMKWPVTNAAIDIPAPRLVSNIPVSVGGVEVSGLSIDPAEDIVFEATVGHSLTIPLKATKRDVFSGQAISLSTFGGGMERHTKFDLPLDGTTTNAVIDLKRLNIKPGEYTIAFYGGAVMKYIANKSDPKAKPKDIVDIYVSQPVRVRVNPAEEK